MPKETPKEYLINNDYHSQLNKSVKTKPTSPDEKYWTDGMVSLSDFNPMKYSSTPLKPMFISEAL